jgi:hypothetical protein
MPEEMVILTRTFDLLTWLLPHCKKFPKAQLYLDARQYEHVSKMVACEWLRT